MIIALRRQMLAQGTTRLEAAEILHRALQSLPEPGCLGDYTDFLTYNREENRTGEFAIKKKLLLHHQTRVAQYLVTLNCFNCQCGRTPRAGLQYARNPTQGTLSTSLPTSPGQRIRKRSYHPTLPYSSCHQTRSGTPRSR